MSYLSLHSQLRQAYAVFEARLKALERHEGNSQTPYMMLAHIVSGQLSELIADDAGQPASPIQCFYPSHTDDPAEYAQPWLETICGAWDRWLVTLTDDPDKDKNSADCLILAQQVRTDLDRFINHFSPGEE